MINSMTGFGRASGSIGSKATVSITARSVNHRYLELSLRVPESLWEMESAIRTTISSMLSRGKVDVAFRLQRVVQPSYDVEVNRAIATALVPELRALATELNLSSSISMADLIRVPDFLQIQPAEDEWSEEEKSGLLDVLRVALEGVRASRAEEGMKLREDLEERLAALDRLHGRLAEERETVRAEAAEHYAARIGEILASAGIDPDRDRVMQETAVAVEKGDIAEELTRLRIHLDAMGELLRSSEPAGKKLDFLSQEVLREINTIGSKSRSAVIRTLVVESKAEMERIREQVQNVE